MMAKDLQNSISRHYRVKRDQDACEPESLGDTYKGAK